MKLNDIKRIRTEDFEQEDRDLIGKLAFALNPFLEQISAAFNKNIDFENLNQEVLAMTVEVDATGVPKTLTDLKSSLKSRVSGLQVIKAVNLEGDGTFLTSAPFITFTLVGNLIRVQHVTGLPANKRYNLTMISYG